MPPDVVRTSVGADTGGTFTDVVAADGSVAKVPSTPVDPGRAVRDGIGALVGERSRPTFLAHGTTVATNALLERRGARVALVATDGLADVVEIARQDRPALYDPFADRPASVVARADRHEVTGRLAPDGTELVPVDEAAIAGLGLGGAEAVAVCLLHSDLEPGHERSVAEVLRGAGHDVTCSHEVSPQMREYERTVTTAINAYLRPPCRTYLAGLVDAADEVLVMTSAGGLAPIDRAAELPATLLLSGPAGGVAAAAAVAEACGFPDAVTFDMGGTSTDVCLVRGGQPEPAGERSVAGLPVRLASLDVHTIGAGGGSLAGVDPGGALAVGPRSAGAVPGPACYGLGGTEPTVTDADLVAGRIPAGTVLPGVGVLDLDAAAAALAAAGVAADDVITVVESAMEQAVRAVTVARGVDPRDLALVAFGGAGPLHACGLADALGMGTVVVPPRAGVLSAVGLLCGARQHDVVRSWPTPADHTGLAQALVALAAEAADALGAASGAADEGDTDGGDAGGVGHAEGDAGGSGHAEGEERVEVEVAVDCRYAGQSHELRVPSVADFPAEHQRRNGYARPGTPIEVIALRATARLPASLAVTDLPAPPREAALGPAVVAEPDCTVFVADGWRADPGPLGALVLTRVPGTAPTAADPHPRRSGDDSGPPRAQDRPEFEVGGVGGGGSGGLDAAGLAVLIARLTGIAEEMGTVLRRAAFSPNIKERADCSAALFTADGTLLVQAEHIPVHLGSMPASVRAAIDAVGLDVEPGVQVVVNDPFAGGTHLNDVTLVAPCHTPDGRLVGWAANRAHHADLGGAAPGSLPADATEIQQEGLRIPPVRFTPEVREVLVASSRTPDERRGDIDAQVGANVVGVERLAALVEATAAPLDEVVAYGERRMRAALAALPDGEWVAEDVVDSTGAADDQREPATVRVAVRIDGDAITFDFSGTDPQRRGNVNAVEAVTVSAAVFALRSALPSDVPANGGGLRAIEVIAPAGSLVAARFPAAVGAGNVEVSQRIADVCLRALAGPAPDRVGAASQGTMNNLLVGGDGWVSYETIAGGQGGRPARPGSPARAGASGIHTAMTNTSQAATDSSAVELAPGTPGQSGIHTCMTNTKNTPIEALERAFPLRVLRQRLRRGSGGAGSAPGGEGIERDLQVLVDATVSLITERRVSQPWGLAGGEPGAVGENWLLPGGDEDRAERLPDKCTIQLKAGDVLRMLTPGGGGWGTSPDNG